MELKFQLIDCDYTMVNDLPVVRLFGKTEDGRSVCAFYEGFLPYFYVLPKKRDEIVEFLKNKYPQLLVKVEEVERYLPIGFSEKKTKVLKIVLKSPPHVADIREELRSSGLIEEIYEADILFKYRFMVDFGLYGMKWIRVSGNPVKTITVKCPAIRCENIGPIEIMENAPLKYLSFDIECLPSEGMPDSKKDQIILISLSFEPAFNGMKDMVILAKNVSILGSIPCSDEKEMLEKFKETIKKYDPDILTGYNIEGFDLPYIFDRMDAHGIKKDLGRADKICFSQKFGSAQRSAIVGRVVIDPFYIIKYLSVYDQPHKFRRYDLSTVAEKILGERKIEFEGSIRTFTEEAWSGNGKKLKQFIEYSKKDSDLALKLITTHRLVDMNKFIEMAKLSGLLLQDLMAGQAARHENALLYELIKKDVLLPCKPHGKVFSGSEKKFEGAIVLEPAVGLHKDGAILILDFKSMYPSMIMQYNICPTVLVREGTKIDNTECNVSPTSTKFLKKSVREGIFPYVARYYFDSRSEVQAQMKKEQDEGKLKILDAKQYALKGMLVSLWGYIGFVGARFYVPEVAASITAWGRENITKTKKLIEENFGYKVIYGDTDSVFVKTDINDLEKAAEKGKEIAKFVTGRLDGLELTFEKLFKTFLILSKKRYAGWSFEKVNNGWKDELSMKGIETIRRDWCDLTSKTLFSVLNILLKEQDTKKAFNYAKDILAKLEKNQIPIEDLIVTKSISKSLKEYKGIQPHIELVKKMRQRSPVGVPGVGDRVGFVIVRGLQLMSDRAEDPEYVKQHGLKVDSRYYIESQLLPPLERVFEAIGIGKSELVGAGRQLLLADIIKNGLKKPKEEALMQADGFVCVKCNKTYRRMPLIGKCSDCNGEVTFYLGENRSRSLNV
jgi:DNA polymerase I